MWLNGRHVVFGEVLEGYDMLSDINMYSTLDGLDTTQTWEIADCGELKDD